LSLLCREQKRENPNVTRTNATPLAADFDLPELWLRAGGNIGWRTTDDGQLRAMKKFTSTHQPAAAAPHLKTHEKKKHK
jgi:hypothetical protein